MFVVCFGDGLGNQMFQYAFYRALQENYPQVSVKMDIFNIYGGHIHNGFELSNIFSIPVKECSRKVAFQLSDYWPRYLKKYKPLNWLSNIRRYICGIKESHINPDDPTAFYDEVFNLSKIKNYIFVGNWVNEKYFESIKEQIKNEFVFPPIQREDTNNYKLYNEIRSSNSISVHVRLGDYKNSIMYNLNIDYYKKAKDIIERKVDNPRYYIFSDDPQNAAVLLETFKDGVLVSGNNGTKSYIDMQLMAGCQHNIIANSTFSFWGGYLNANKNKIVVAPNKAAPNMSNPFACKDWILVEI